MMTNPVTDTKGNLLQTDVSRDYTLLTKIGQNGSKMEKSLKYLLRRGLRKKVNICTPENWQKKG